jgi:hypothetical protein
VVVDNVHDAHGGPRGCPDASEALGFDAEDAFEAELEALGCVDKTLVKSSANRDWFSALCPDTDSVSELVEAWSKEWPYKARFDDDVCDALADGDTVVAWDPSGGSVNPYAERCYPYSGYCSSTHYLWCWNGAKWYLNGTC